MAKENEKKVSGEMNEEELENVAGGMCLWGGVSAPSDVKSAKKVENKNGTYSIVTYLKSGQEVHTVFNSDGNILDVYSKGK